MPERRAVLQIGLLLLALPTQYLVSYLYSTSAGERSTALKDFMSSAVGFQEKYLSWHSWHDWCVDIIDDIKFQYSSQPFKQSYNPRGENPATDVFMYKEPNGYFTRSMTVRSPRPEHVEYHIGQVIRHKIHGYRGVIIGWDPSPKAPKDWLEKSHNQNDLKRLQSSPFYAILIHTQDTGEAQLTYVAQEFITPIYRTQIEHPLLYDYMDSYEGMRYVPRPWLRVLYPHD